MKIVLVYKQEIKLYNGQLTYDMLAKFVATQFQLAYPSLQLTFKDDENDNITIHSNDDLEVMQAVFQGNQYTKITVEGAPALIQVQPQSSQEKIGQTITTEEAQPSKEEQKTQIKTEEQAKQCPRRWGKGMRRSHSRGHGSPRDWSGHKKQHMKKMKGFFNQMITKMVDERINNLLPILKEKILKGEEPSEIISNLIHEGIVCKSCNMNPINGIRYKCPTCVDYNLCENCEHKIPHEHPLLKIKKILNENQEKGEFDDFKKMFKKFFKGHHRHHGHSSERYRESSSSKQKCHRRRGHQYHKKIWGLSALFGGEPEQYISFAEKYEDLRPKDTYKKYAEVNGIPEEEFKEKFTTFRSQKLSKCFGNPPEKYRDFVANNIDLTQKDLMHALFDQGIEKKENKRCGWGRRFNFNQMNEECKQKKEKFCFKKEKTISKEKKQNKSVSKGKKEEINITESIISEPKPLDTLEIRKAKGAILMNMIDLFGPERSSEYMKFVDKNFALGEEKIIDLWIKQ